MVGGVILGSETADVLYGWALGRGRKVGEKRKTGQIDSALSETVLAARSAVLLLPSSTLTTP